MVSLEGRLMSARCGMVVARWVVAGLLVAGVGSGGATAQLARRGTGGNSGDVSGQITTKKRTRLVLKDGSYQMVMSYEIVGANVRYVSSEREGETEMIPLALIDMVATKRYEAQHAAGAVAAPGPVLDPELLKEEADRAALTPEVATDLRLEPEMTVMALDTFHGEAQLVPLQQTDSDLNKQTGHNILKSTINPLASQHQIVQLKGEKADVQLHVSEPVLYLKLDDALPEGGGAITVDTHGASGGSGKKEKPVQPNEYVIVRVDVRKGARVVASFNLSALAAFEGKGAKRQEDVVETTTTVLPGGHWLKIAPKEPLLIGEYCLVEVLGERSLNLGVWDFGVHPTAPENRDVVRPEKRRPVGLERRR